MEKDYISKNIVWLAWERHRRTLELCRYFRINLIIFESTLPRLVKQPFFIAKTIGYLLWKRPRILIVQNPSIVLTLLGCLLRRLLGFYYIVDAHNGGIIPDSPIGKKIPFLYRLWETEASLTMVTNRFMADIVEDNGGTALILPDKLPELRENCKQFKVGGRINILCISTFDADEPFQEVFAASKGLPEDYVIYMTGDYSKIDTSLPKICPRQIKLTGFLSEVDYWALLRSVDLVMDLTNRENCLVCGAYEAISQRKPLILSDTLVLRAYFAKGTIFTQNDRINIRNAILTAIDNLEELQHEMEAGIFLLEEEWKIQGERLAYIMQDNL